MWTEVADMDNNAQNLNTADETDLSSFDDILQKALTQEEINEITAEIRF